MGREALLGGKVLRVSVGLFEDERGLLGVIQFGHNGFQAVRAFVVAAAGGAVRGGHGHRRGRQVLMHLSGSIDVELRYRGQAEHLRLDQHAKALLIEPPVWSVQSYAEQGSSMIVFCDTPYDPDDYFEDPNDAA